MRALRFQLLLLLLAVVGSPAPVSADEHDETEHRLKTAGVDEGLRREIHRAVRRGVAFLRKQQLRDGSFAAHAGWTSLAGLALRHAAIPDGVQASRRAIRWLESRGRRRAIAETYNAGLAAMLLHADGRSGDLQHAIHEALALGPLGAGDGYWDYASRGGLPVPNLSTAQFGCLGLWAGERSDEPVAARAWQRHVRALLEAQVANGSWRYRLAGTPDGPAPHGYATGTFMGLANLLLAEQALGDLLPGETDLWIRIRLARARALVALRRHARWALEAPEPLGPLGDFHYYGLYALEKACVFLDREEVGGLPWYRVGARWLIDRQERDGGWAALSAPPRPRGNDVVVIRQPIETSFALLFLLRASESYRPITPRPVGGGPVTTPGEAPAPRGATPPDEPPVLPLPVAERMVEDLAARLARPAGTGVAEVLAGLDFVRRTWSAYRPDDIPLSEAHDAWCRRVEDLLLDVAFAPGIASDAPSALQQLVSLEALELLGSTTPRVGLRLLARVRARGSGEGLDPHLRVAFFGAAFEALRRLEPPGLVAFLREGALSPAPADGGRTAAALTALAGLPRLPGAERYATAKAALETLRPLFTGDAPTADAADLLRDLHVLLRRLAGPEAAADVPSVAGLDTRSAYADLRRWFGPHDRPGARIWRD